MVCAGASQRSAVAAEVWVQESGCQGTEGTDELRASPQLLRGVHTAVQAPCKAAEKQQQAETTEGGKRRGPGGERHQPSHCAPGSTSTTSGNCTSKPLAEDKASSLNIAPLEVSAPPGAPASTRGPSLVQQRCNRKYTTVQTMLSVV